jgi:hypothetical protein
VEYAFGITVGWRHEWCASVGPRGRCVQAYKCWALYRVWYEGNNRKLELSLVFSFVFSNSSSLSGSISIPLVSLLHAHVPIFFGGQGCDS